MKIFLLTFLTGISFFSGTAQWAGNTPICTTSPSTAKTNLSSIDDGNGNMIVAWEDSRNAATGNRGSDIYIQKINKNGSLGWNADGVVVCSFLGNQTGISITSDGAGGAVVVWNDNRDSTANKTDLYAQRVTAAGVVLWAANGIGLKTDANNITSPNIELVNATEAMIFYRDDRNTAITGVDLFLMKISIATGVVAGSDLSVCAATGTQQGMNILADGTGGAYVCWEDPRVSTDRDVYYDRISNALVPSSGIGVNGFNIASATDIGVASKAQQQPGMCSDGLGGIVIAWSDLRADNGDIYAQRISSTLSPQWTVGGRQVGVAAQIQSNPKPVYDGSGGIIVAWSDTRTASPARDIYAHRIQVTDGTLLWNGGVQGGVVVTAANGSQPGSSTTSDIFVVPSTPGTAIVLWADARTPGSGSNMDIYGQKMNAGGTIAWSTDGVLISKTNSQVPVLATGNQRQPVALGSTTGFTMVLWPDARNGFPNGEIYGVGLNADSTLPLQFIDIAGKVKDNSIQVLFTTAQEQNLANLIIEKSIDGVSFTRINTVKPSNTIAGNKYQITDVAPVKGNNYYRVLAVDKDGTLHYSPTAVVNFNQKISIEWKLYPVPAAAALTLRVTNADNGIYGFAITDLQGKILLQNGLNINSTLFSKTLDVSGLSKGIYFSRLADNTGKTIWFSKFIKE